jgi:hypothetical protein
VLPPAAPGALEEEPAPPELPELPAPLPPPEVALSEVPEVPELLDEGDAPEGDAPEGEAPDDEGVLDGVAGGMAPGLDDDDVPEGEAPEDEDEELSPPAAGVDGVLGVVALLLLGEAGVELDGLLEVDPGEAEVPEPEPEPAPAPPPESLLQPASRAASRLAANSALEGWVSFIVAFLSN